MFKWMTENGRLQKRYGGGLILDDLDEQLRDLLNDPRIKDYKDGRGLHPVQLTTSDEPNVVFALTDIYTFKSHKDRISWSDYAAKRFQIYKELTGGRVPLHSGTNESRYRLSDDKSLISITIDAFDHSKGIASRSL